MREIALNNVALMLTVYAATLVWSMQHIADRYTPKLVPFFLRHIAILPLSLLGILLIIAGILVLRPLPHLILSLISFGLLQSLPLAGDILALILLLGSIGVVLWAGYRVAQHLTDGTQLISWLHGNVDQQTALQEILLSAIPRTDKHVVTAALDKGLSSQTTKQTAFIDWLVEHSNLLASDWLTRILLGRILNNKSNASNIKPYENLLRVLFIDALDDEVFPRTLFITESILDFLEHAATWTQSHADLLDIVGFSLWKIGEKNASVPRVARISGQLEQVRVTFDEGVGKIWQHLLNLNDFNAVQSFSHVLGKIAIETSNDSLRSNFLNHIQNLINDGFRRHLLTLQAIQGLAKDLGAARPSDLYNEGIQKPIDVLLIDLAAMHVELGGSTEALNELLENGYILERLALGTELHSNKHDWLKPESYTAIANRLTLPGFV